MPGMLGMLVGRFTTGLFRNIFDTRCFISSTLAVAIARLIVPNLKIN